MFEPSVRWNGMVYITNRGTVYKIFWGPLDVKPCWIGMLDEQAKAWFTVETVLRARELEFENGARYTFP